MLFLLDANVLIDAHRDYYPMGRVPEFWSWLAHHARQGTVKVPREIFHEPKSGNDELAEWLKRGHEGCDLLLGEEPEEGYVAAIVDTAYAEDLTDEEVTKIGRDPFLIAYALVDPAKRCVVTTEVSRPKRQRANRHVPDVCNDLGVRWCNTFQFIRELDFTTSWHSKA